jgi:hypothetical protein
MEHPLETALKLLANAQRVIAKDLEAVKAENEALVDQANLAYVAAKAEAQKEIEGLRRRLSAAYETRAGALNDAAQALAKLERVLAAEAQEAALIEKAGVHPERVWFKVAPKGGVSAYGFGFHPVTLYQDQWVKLLANKEKILAFIRKHEAKLKKKPAVEKARGITTR